MKNPERHSAANRSVVEAAMLGLLFGLAGCGDFTEVPALLQMDEVSDCLRQNPVAYCDAEVLHWQYDSGTETLTLRDTRVLLNCCGDHSMQVSWNDGSYTIDEVDDLVEVPARCRCMCVFDFSVTVQGIPDRPVPFKLIRTVTEDPQASGEKKTGELDLGQREGFLIIDESSVEPYCSLPPL